MAHNIIVALDKMSEKKALSIARRLKGLVWGFKVNDLLYESPKIIGKLKKFGKVFADAKLHDIPNTVANSVAKLSRAGADIITIHASGGIEMMKAAKARSGSSRIFAVTILTSAKPNPKGISRLVGDVIKAGINGVVCSGRDILNINRIAGSRRLLKIVPGIRPMWYKVKDDQRRTTTPGEAIELGADYLVIGRPITNAKDPVEALRKIQINT